MKYILNQYRTRLSTLLYFIFDIYILKYKFNIIFINLYNFFFYFLKNIIIFINAILFYFKLIYLAEFNLDSAMRCGLNIEMLDKIDDGPVFRKMDKNK